MTIKLTKSMFSWFCLASMMAFGLQLNAQSSSVVIGSGAAAGTYNSANTTWSPNFATLAGDLSLTEDGSGTNTACMPLTNGAAVMGKIALIDRGACAFATKGVNAEAAGAIGAIICNSIGGTPFTMLGDVNVTIPVLVLDSTSCANIKVAMGTETVSVTMNGPADGETCISAITAVDGTNTAVMSTAGFGGTIFGGGTHATWYTYTVPQDGLTTIASCGGGADTRLIGVIAADCAGILAPIQAGAFFASVDDCDDGGGNIVASTATLIVNAGDVIKFFFDDAQSTDGFDFTIGTVDFPAVDVTFNVDMSQQTVDPGGVNIQLDGNVSAMTDNGDGTWSFTATTATANSHAYTFWNGAVQEDASLLTDCGDGTNRTLQVLSTTDLSLAAVCFESCIICPPPGCADPSIVYCDDIEGYDLGGIGSAQSTNWTSWGGTPGAADEAEVSDVQAFSGTQSVLVSEANGDDAVFALGETTTGKYGMSWAMYVPSGSDAYWNIQKISSGFSGAGEDFNMQTPMEGGTGEVNTDNQVIATYSYPNDTWFPINIVFDLDNDMTSLAVNGVNVASWTASQTITAGPGAVQIGAINFFGNTNNTYYVDDVYFQEVVLASDNCADPVDLNPLLGGTFMDPVVSALYTNIGMATNGSDPADGFDCYGEPDGAGAGPSLETTQWFYFVGDGNTYQITSVECNATDFLDSGDTQMSLYTGTCGNLTAIDCNEDAPGVDPNGPYPAQLEIATVAGQAYWLMVDAFNFQGTVSDGEYCLQATNMTSPPTSMVTFNVDYELEMDFIDARIAGEMNGFAGEAMTLVTGTMYTATYELIQGDTIEYKFQNGMDGWEEIDGDCTLGGFGNRFVVVGTEDMTIPDVCFAYCLTCIEVGIDALSFEGGINVFPNPASESVNIAYNFNESIELEVSVINTLGQTVKQLPTNTVDQGMINVNIAELSAGVYFLNFRHGAIQTSRRIIVE